MERGRRDEGAGEGGDAQSTFEVGSTGKGKMAEKSETKLDGLIKRVDYLIAEFMRSFWQANPQSK
jgi:hypothetical protein